METVLEAMRWLFLAAFLVAGGWLLYQAALIGEAQRRRQDQHRGRVPRHAPLRRRTLHAARIGLRRGLS